jgi:hypothetical protein
MGSVAWLLPSQAQGLLSWLRQMAQHLTDLSAHLPAHLIVLIASAAIWTIGLRSDWQSHSSVWRSFVRGTVALSLLIILDLAVSAARGRIVGPVLGFALSGLLALAIRGARQIGGEGESLGRLTLNRYWLLTVVVVVGVIVIAGWGIGRIVSPAAVSQVWRMLRPIWQPVLEVIRGALVVLAYGIAWLLRPLIGLFERGASGMVGLELGEPPSFEELAQEPFPAGAVESPVSVVASALVGLALLAGMVALFVRIWRRRVRLPAGEGPLEERESIWSLDLARRQLRSVFGRASMGDRQRPFLDIADDEERRRAVRQLYQRMLARTAALGWPRPPSATPRAYGAQLAQWAPAAEPAIRRLTGIYQRARYGREAPTSQQVGQALRAWSEVEAALVDDALSRTDSSDG